MCFDRERVALHGARRLVNPPRAADRGRAHREVPVERSQAMIGDRGELSGRIV